MANIISNGTVAFLLFAAMVLLSANAIGLPSAEQVTSTAQPLPRTDQSEKLSHEIIQLFNDDQALIAEMSKALQDPAFRQAREPFVKRAELEDHNPNFYDAAVYEYWAQTPGAPESVQRYAAIRRATDAHIESIVTAHGWPQRDTVGDDAAADFFFLFGHADDDNAWRLAQLDTLTRVFREDHVNPRLYAHLCDRLANVAGKPQKYGTVMGPGPSPGTAKLYWPLIDDVAAADKRRLQIGLPSIENDLERFRKGADIGPYMTPLTQGENWSMADVYKKP
ncbi:hypothetical protein ACPOL_0614 [Acidisarcina polymorpha]|uniref:Uncharacterized protein n=1 Tax=Acidisarcina polymorpha TaxID=2211140 RepID=A0A2Z5FU81_9BACT|nr:DUF6624 domain-containing protein [Acidisarcina polymorpha]AXC09985.1 hypothetical protein ACPOL_0614 [Acidisarcina polymorpha]